MELKELQFEDLPELKFEETQSKTSSNRIAEFFTGGIKKAGSILPGQEHDPVRKALELEKKWQEFLGTKPERPYPLNVATEFLKGTELLKPSTYITNMLLGYGAGKVVAQTQLIRKGLEKYTPTLSEKLLEFLPEKTKVPTSNPIVNISNNIKNITKPAKFAGKVRQSFFDAKKIAGQEFEQGLQQQALLNPDRRINLRSLFEDFKMYQDDIVNNPGMKSEVKGIIRKTKRADLQAMIDNPALAENLTLRQVQDIKNAINQAPSIAKKAGNKFANWTSGEGELLDLVDEIRLAELENFPGMENVFSKYADKMGQYRLIKNKFKEGSLIRNLKTGFGDPEIKEMVKVYFKDNPQIIKEMGGYEKTLKFLKWVGLGAGLDYLRRLLKGQP